MSVGPLPAGVFVGVEDARRYARWLAMLVDLRHKYELGVDAVLDADLERLAAAVRAIGSSEVRGERDPVRELPILDAMPQGWVCVGEACTSGLVPVGKRALQKAVHRGRVEGAYLGHRNRMIVNVESVKEHTWHVSSQRTAPSTARSKIVPAA